MFLRLSFVTLVLALSALGIPAKRDAAQVEKDIQSMSTETNSLDAAIKAFSSSDGTLEQALAIHSAAETLENVIEGATDDANASSTFSESEGSTIMSDATALASNVKPALDDIVATKAAFAKLGLTSVVKTDISNLGYDTQQFGKALITKMPADMQSEAQSLADQINDWFEEAVAAYA